MPDMSRIMGLDVGDRRIGIALSDPSKTLATPLKTILRRSDDTTFQEISGLIDRYGIGKLVIGLPFSLDGSIGKQAEKVLEFKSKLEKQINIDIIMQDERLSSVTANQRLREAGKKGDKLKSGIDSAAATVILQCYLDTLDQDVSV